MPLEMCNNIIRYRKYHQLCRFNITEVSVDNLIVVIIQIIYKLYVKTYSYKSTGIYVVLHVLEKRLT